MKLGKTGDFPHGKSSNDDEGELRLAVGRKDRLVEVHFGSPVVWFSMPPDLARQFANTLISHANLIDGGALTRPEPAQDAGVALAHREPTNGR